MFCLKHAVAYDSDSETVLRTSVVVIPTPDSPHPQRRIGRFAVSANNSIWTFLHTAVTLAAYPHNFEHFVVLVETDHAPSLASLVFLYHDRVSPQSCPGFVSGRELVLLVTYELTPIWRPRRLCALFVPVVRPSLSS